MEVEKNQKCYKGNCNDSEEFNTQHPHGENRKIKTIHEKVPTIACWTRSHFGSP
jgi:hypothetical protein